MIAGQTLPHLSLHVAAFVKNKVASDNASQNHLYKVEGTTQVLLRLRTWSRSTQVSLLDPSSHYLASVCWASSTRLVVRLVERRHVLDIIVTMLLFTTSSNFLNLSTLQHQYHHRQEYSL